jgi:hypothetical protein
MEGMTTMTKEAIPGYVTSEEALAMVRTCERLTAQMWVRVSKAVVDKYGNEGRELLGKVVREQGLARGKAIRKRAEQQGWPLNSIHTFYEAFEVAFPIWFSREGEKIEVTDKHSVVRFHHCAFGRQMAALHSELGTDVGKIWCENCEGSVKGHPDGSTDHALAAGYDPKLKFHPAKHILRGDPYCEHHMWWSSDEQKPDGKGE